MEKRNKVLQNYRMEENQVKIKSYWKWLNVEGNW